jgi:multidrug efflux pump subunit AcrA (membrane-fusion protein)
MEKNKKKILIGSVSGIAAAVLLTGIIVAAVQGSGKAVKVAPVSNMNSGGWSSGSEISDYGTVTTNMNQDIYYDESLTVKEVYVKAGDTVKIGDRLVAYDTTLATMEKEMKQMEIEGIALNSCEDQCGRNRYSRKRRYREEQDNSISAEAEYDCSGRKYGYRNGRIGSGFNGDRWKRDR